MTNCVTSVQLCNLASIQNTNVMWVIHSQDQSLGDGPHGVDVKSGKLGLARGG